MLRALQHAGDALDRCDAAGWLLMLVGFAIVAITSLAPAYLDVRHLNAQSHRVHRQERLLRMRHEGYLDFAQAIRDNDPLLMQRIAWHQLNVKPAGATPLHRLAPMPDEPAPSVDDWVRPWLPPVDEAVLESPYPDTRLTRLATSSATRPWVLAFGGWLILAGLLINPRTTSRSPSPT